MTGHMIAFQGGASFPPVVVNLSQGTIAAARSGAGFVQTGIVTATATGGNGGPYTYTWTRTFGDTQITAQNPNSSSTRFQATVGVADSFNADFDCVASDGVRSSAGANCNVTISEFS